jgi:hypothetical protein
LQALAEAQAAAIATTPGACQTGRSLGSDDPDRYGFDEIVAALKRDGTFAFRLISASTAESLRQRLDALGFRLDTWDVFIADRATALSASEAILARGLPDGLVALPAPTEPEGADVVAIQTLMAEAGVVPFSGSLLVGAYGPAITVAVGTSDGRPVAAAHSYLPHNALSPYRGHAWGGLVAVADDWRGRSLGAHINARMIAAIFAKTDATHVVELVSTTTMPSRRMVAACGLTLDPGLVCGMAMPRDSGRFTR